MSVAGRATVEAWGEDDTVAGGAADMWGQVAAAARESGEARGRGRRAGLLAGLAARVGPTCCCARKRGWPAAARWRAEQAEPAAGLLHSFLFFCFIFLFLCLNSN